MAHTLCEEVVARGSECFLLASHPVLYHIVAVSNEVEVVCKKVAPQIMWKECTANTMYSIFIGSILMLSDKTINLEAIMPKAFLATFHPLDNYY
jgi:hypothetical protein